MANEEHVEILKSGVETWNKWRRINKEIKPHLAEADLSEINIVGANLERANLERANLEGANLERANLEGANLEEANLSEAKLNNANLTEVFSPEVNLSGADLSNANLSWAFLIGSNLTGTNLSWADATGANLISTFTTHSNWYGVKISASTQFKNLRFSSEHQPFHDNTNTLIIPWHLRYLQWSFIRNIGQLPLFGVSWIGLATSLLILNNLGWWNSSFARQILLLTSGVGPIPENLTFEISIPGRLVLTVLDALLLVIGSTLYKFACPQRIQTFTEVAWVEQHRNPRLLYLSESFSRPVLRVVTLFFLLLGGLLTLYLLGASIVSATRYAWPVMVQWALS